MHLVRPDKGLSNLFRNCGTLRINAGPSHLRSWRGGNLHTIGHSSYMQNVPMGRIQSVFDDLLI